MERIICSLINKTSYNYQHNVLVLYEDTTASKWISRSNVQITCMHRSPNQLKYISRLYSILKEKKPDLLMSYNWGSTDAIWIARLLGFNKIIHSEHGFNVDEATSTLFRRNMMRLLIYRMCSQIVVVSHELKSLMKTQYHLNKDRVTLIANGIDAAHYTPDLSERARTRKTHKIRQDDFVIGFVGRLDPIKNFKFMFEILSQYKTHDQKFKIMLIGEGPEKAFIQQQCSENHLENHLLLLGEKENILPFLRAMDVFLLTSFREQMPMTILEAMAVGLPIVSTHVGEAPHMITNGQEGFILDRQATPETFASTLLQFRDREKRQQMGDAARRKVVTTFREDHMVQRYENLIDHLF